MAVILEQFVQTLSESGIMTAADVQKFLEQLPENERPKDGQEMATQLFRHGRLTKFQAQAVYRGKAKGLILGDYLILDEIGRGGMGQVYKAEHRRMKRIVALKILPRELTDSPGAVSRFQQEVEAAARLIHNNIVTAFDAGETKKTHFLVMEYVEGTNLEDLVAQRGRLSVAEAIDYILQVARGLEYAHDEGVIHRDIKPSNLLLHPHGTVKILDMGLARVERKIGELEGTLDRGLTQSGDVMGTVDYMSPEQAASSKHVDARTDIYSVGCTLYYLLVGQPIFPGDTLVEKVLAHRDQPAPALQKRRSDVPSSLCSVFRRMVGKKPEYRFRSMKELIAALEKCEVPPEAQRPAPASASASSRPAAETRVPTQTLPAGALPSAPPPPPELTPRDRSPAPRVEKTVRRKQAVAQAKATEHQKQRKQAWENAVHDAVREQKSKARWKTVWRILNEGAAGVTKWLLLLALCGGAAGGSYFVWQNTDQLLTSRERAQTGINRILQRTTFEPIESFEFTHTSFLKPVPETLEFELPLVPSSRAGARQPAVIKGQFQRTDGTLTISEPFQMQAKVDPVP